MLNRNICVDNLLRNPLVTCIYMCVCVRVCVCADSECIVSYGF